MLPAVFLPACRRLLFPLLHAEKGRRPFSAFNKGNRRRLHAGELCSCYLLFDVKRLPRRLRFINDQIVKDDFWSCWL